MRSEFARGGFFVGWGDAGPSTALCFAHCQDAGPSTTLRFAQDDKHILERCR
jgi:hypothetical protein